MKQLASSTSRHAKHLQSAVRFNIGRAYFQGYGVKPQSDSEAEKYVGKKWLSVSSFMSQLEKDGVVIGVKLSIWLWLFPWMNQW